MKAHDSEQLKDATRKEFQDLKEAGVFELTPITKIQKIENQCILFGALNEKGHP